MGIINIIFIRGFWNRILPFIYRRRERAKGARNSQKIETQVAGSNRTVKMSGKKIVEKAAKTIDWDGMSKLLISDNARREFFNLRRAYEEVKRTLDTKFSQEPQPIDWEYYRKGIGSRLVDMYKEAYEGVKIPKYVDKVTPEYKPKFEALEAKEAEQKSLQESERLEKEIAKIQELKKKITTMTADEYFAQYPELKAKFDEEIKNDYWGY